MQDNDFGQATLEPLDMAKKKLPAAPPARSTQKILISYKADPQTFDAYKEWLDGLAEYAGMPVTIVLDLALKEFAERCKYRKQPRRLAR